MHKWQHLLYHEQPALTGVAAREFHSRPRAVFASRSLQIPVSSSALQRFRLRPRIIHIPMAVTLNPNPAAAATQPKERERRGIGYWMERVAVEAEKVRESAIVIPKNALIPCARR